VTIEADRAHRPDEYLVIEGNEKVAALADVGKSFVDTLCACAEG
jgi:hypothetical protein